jgi:hypothetical protein
MKLACLLLFACLFTFGQNPPPAEVQPAQIEVEVTTWPGPGTLEVKLLNGQKWPTELPRDNTPGSPQWPLRLFGTGVREMMIVTDAKNTVLAITHLGPGKLDLPKVEKDVLDNLGQVFATGAKVKVVRRQTCRWGRAVVEPICR